MYAKGFTAIQDIAFGKHDKGKSTLYVYELAKDGVLAFEAGLETGEFPPAVLLEVDQARPRVSWPRASSASPAASSSRAGARCS